MTSFPLSIPPYSISLDFITNTFLSDVIALRQVKFCHIFERILSWLHTITLLCTLATRYELRSHRDNTEYDATTTNLLFAIFYVSHLNDFSLSLFLGGLF